MKISRAPLAGGHVDQYYAVDCSLVDLLRTIADEAATLGDEYVIYNIHIEYEDEGDGSESITAIVTYDDMNDVRLGRATEGDETSK